MQSKLLVLSMDAMIAEDLEYLRDKPNFKRLFAACARVRKVRTIYPSITYPAHTSVITGCRPGKHGVTDNTVWKTVEDGRNDWFLYADKIKTDDLFAAAKRAGRSTAGIFWPVTGLHPHIDYLIDECFDNFMPGVGPLDFFRRLGASGEAMDVIRRNMYRYPVNNRAQAGLQKYNSSDHFLNGCACEVIRRFKPDLTMIHNSYLDTARHRYGVFHEKITEGLDYTDCWLGELIDALEEAGIYGQTNFVLISDHGQMDFSRRIRLNVKLVRDGFITLNPDRSVADWSVFTKSTGMSALVYIKNPGDRALWKRAHEYLNGLAAEGVWGFDRIYTTEQALEAYGLNGDFSFILETDGFSAFADSWKEPIYNPIDFSDYRLGQATHGYEPEKGPQPVFCAAGPDFRPGAVMETADIIDEGPTFARILGAALNDAEGRCLSELLR
ncbi:MAG TPA: ectonucleotide pyrophosphatase/phosphodiesterase [Clostridia bacterium]|nr:ectonucleotide pyrophosphatase/phosphodiesterase [Clostridia bacterium]